MSVVMFVGLLIVVLVVIGIVNLVVDNVLRRIGELLSAGFNRLPDGVQLFFMALGALAVSVGVVMTFGLWTIVVLIAFWAGIGYWLFRPEPDRISDQSRGRHPVDGSPSPIPDSAGGTLGEGQ